MKIILAPDSFKGSFSAYQVASSIEKGIRQVYEDAHLVKLPVADGGEGSVDALVGVRNGRYEEVEVLGPLGEIVKAKYGIIDGNIAIIEMAAASGITLIDDDKLNPLITTSYGTGQLIKSAMEKGIRKIYIGIGGSATNDGGLGMAQALGLSFKDRFGQELGFGGGLLNTIEEIDFTNVHPLLKETQVLIMSDVQNPLCGPNGASYIFGPQKGASEQVVEILDKNLRHFAEKIKEYTGKDIINIPGAGGAGGLGAGLLAFCNATVSSGIDKILDMINIDYHLKDADIVITGEGMIDGQSIFGKVPVGVAKRAKKYDIPVIAIVASIGQDAEIVFDHGIDMIVDIIDKPMTLDQAKDDVSILIERATIRLFKFIKSRNRF